MCLCLAAPAAADEPLEVAKARFEQGEKNFEAGRFLEAAADFEAAYKLTPRPDLLYDAGHAYDRAGDVARAVEFYEAYLRTGEGLPEEARVNGRLTELRRQVAYILVKANREGARIFIDGQERATTPMLIPLPVRAGPHQVEVRLGDMSFRAEQHFASELTHTVNAELVGPPRPEPEEWQPNRKLAVALGVGGVINILGDPFPPSQASLSFGLEYRLFERKVLALDLTLRVPVEVGQQWTNSGLLPGLRLVLVLSHKIPFELVPGLDFGLSVLHYGAGPPKSPKMDDICGAQACTLIGFRIHPSLNLVYHFLPNWELRAELFGLTADLTRPLPNPRVSFGLSAAWRFF